MFQQSGLFWICNDQAENYNGSFIKIAEFEGVSTVFDW